MSFVETVERARQLLERNGRLSLRALKREFALDEDALEELAEELVEVQRVAAREGNVLVWAGAGERTSAPRVPETEPDGRAAERRQPTVLFCDLVDSTRLAAGMDAEDWRALVQRYHAATGEVVARFEGHVAQYLGDGLLAYFGWPRAHEDDAERAVRAGLGIVQALGADGAHALSVRIGIHTGPVVVGESGGAARRETLALGDTTNLAARLQGVAEPNTAVMSAATLRLVSGIFVTRDRGAHALEGIDEPVRVHQAIRPSGVRSRLDVTAAGDLTPLVGRDQELMLLEDRFAQVREARGHAVLIQGEAGIGKSRLVGEFRGRIVERGHTWLECRASPYTQGSALYPVLELVRLGLGIALSALSGWATKESEQAWRRSLALAEGPADEVSRAAALGGLARTHQTRRELAEGLRYARELRDLGMATADLERELGGWQVIISCHLMLGEVESAVEALDRCLDRDTKRELPQAWLRHGLDVRVAARSWGAWALAFRCGALIVARDAEEFRRSGDELARLGEEQVAPVWHGVGRLFRAWARAVRGEDAAQQAADVLAALGVAGSTGNLPVAPFMMWCHADALRLAGRHAEALEFTGGALTISAQIRQPFYDAEPHRSRGELLAPIYAWFTEGGGTLDLVEAKSLLDELA